jgi:hypothetical protein
MEVLGSWSSLAKPAWEGQGWEDPKKSALPVSANAAMPRDPSSALGFGIESLFSLERKAEELSLFAMVSYSGHKTIGSKVGGVSKRSIEVGEGKMAASVVIISPALIRPNGTANNKAKETTILTTIGRDIRTPMK